MADGVERSRQGFLLSALELTDLDRRIIAHLQQDGRKPYIDIAREEDVTEKTVRARVRQLVENQSIRIVALCTPTAMGYGACAMVGLRTSPGVDEVQLTEQISKLDAVDYVTLSYGRYNLLVEILARDDKELRRVLQEDLGKLPGIRNQEVFPYHSVYYQQAATSLSGSRPSGQGVLDKPLSEFDRSLIRILGEDGRMSFRAVAEQTSASEAKVRQRVQDMIADGQMQILALVNPLGLSQVKVAWLAIRAGEGQSLRELAARLAQDNHVSYIAICAGRYDIFAEIISPPGMDLLDLIDSGIRPLKGVRELEIFPYSSLHYKRLTPPL